MTDLVGSDAGEAVAPPATGPRRALLAQHRSRRTRAALVDAALALWTERGFETGIETTTVEEIARAAGVTKGTFYFHFARKVDVLLEMNATIDDAAAKAAQDARREGRSIDDALDRALAVLAERTERMPREALAQILREYHRSPVLARERSAFRTLLPRLLADARDRGELPDHVDPQRLANLVAASIVAACDAWADGRAPRLAPDLRYARRVLLAGARAVES